jgi:hypothetical protein
MPCAEIRELETSFSKYADRRQKMVIPQVECRKVFDLRNRAIQARGAYLIFMHRLK